MALRQTVPVAPSDDPMLLLGVVREIERYAAADGWDRAPRLFALADTAQLVAKEPALAELLGATGEGATTNPLTPVEQEQLPLGRTLEETLTTVGWPTDVVGCAVVVERVMLPPSAEATLADVAGDDLSDGELAELAAQHPERQDVRMVVAVLRDGRRECALRLRAHDTEEDVLTGPDLVPGLADALLATLG